MVLDSGSSEKTTTLLHTVNLAEFSPDVETWLVWKEKLEIHFVEIGCTDDNKKKATLLKLIGSAPYNLLHSVCSPDTPVSKTYKALCELLKEHYTPPTIVFMERKMFHTAKKRDDETVAAWYGRVKQLALNCNFGDSLDAFILDKFIIELPSKIFDKLCEETETLTHANALKKAMIMEVKCAAKSPADNNVNFIKPHGRKQNNGKTGNNNNNKAHGKKACTRCGWRNHESNNCKFKDSVCHSCSKTGHLASVCRSKNKTNKSGDSLKYISNSNLNNNFDQFDDNSFNFSIYSVSNGVSDERYLVPVKLDGVDMEIECDSGSPCIIIPFTLFRRLSNQEKLRPCKIPFKNYDGSRIEQIVGEYDAFVTHRGATKKIPIVVSKTNSPPLLGRSFLRSFGFKLTINSIRDDTVSTISSQIKSDFSEVFDNNLGAFTQHKISISIDQNAKPVFFKPRPVPFAWKSKIENQLRDLVKKDVLEPVQSSHWGTPLVPVLKPNGDIRICGDYKVTINRHLVDVRYPLPRIQEIFTALQGGELFSKLDMSCAYNQLILDEESQLLCTWSTHIGTFKMKRLPYGIKPAAAIFQKTIEELLRDIKGVVVYQDDITVTGKNLQEHVQNLRLVLNRLQSNGLRLNSNKCSFFQEKITYLGFTIDKTGLYKNNERIESIINAPIPKNVHELKAFCGMVNYLSIFVDKFADLMVPFYTLLQKNVKFQWNSKLTEAYELIKKEISSDQVLAHFNPELPIVLSTDASNYAVAGVLAHLFPDGNTKPVAFVSRALTKSEQNYSTLEKESLAIIFSVIKLKQYLIGYHFTLQTDHKPLVSIFGENKGLPIMAAARMQRWAFILSGFNYTIKYISGNSNCADNLSRIAQTQSLQINSIDFSYVNSIENENPLNISFKNIAIETRRDPILSKLIDSINNGTVGMLNKDEYAPFRNKADELSVESGCVMWGYRTIIPTKLRNQIMTELHRSHLGIVKTKSLARSYVWWPKMDSDIEKFINDCVPCQQLQASPEKSALIPWMPTASVWSRIHMDFAGPIKNFHIFIVVDSHSKWAEAFKTKTITSHFVVEKLRELFCRYGIPDMLVSDNGRQFTSKEFEQFTTANGINHVFTPPGHPATNGQAESFVKMIKKSILACLKDEKPDAFDTIINRFLFDYRNTKHCTTAETPAKIFFNRTVKTRFSSLRPPLIKEKIIQSQAKSIKNHKGKREINFAGGQNVFIRDYRNPNKPSWSRATIKNKLGPRSYTCIVGNREIKRHTDQIRGKNCIEESITEQTNDNASQRLNGGAEDGSSSSAEGSRQLDADQMNATKQGEVGGLSESDSNEYALAFSDPIWI